MVSAPQSPDKISWRLSKNKQTNSVRGDNFRCVLVSQVPPIALLDLYFFSLFFARDAADRILRN